MRHDFLFPVCQWASLATRRPCRVAVPESPSERETTDNAEAQTSCGMQASRALTPPDGQVGSQTDATLLTEKIS